MAEKSKHKEKQAKRKERVLHTRISEKLAEDIVRVAEDLRVPVSNLVRNVLEDAFSVVETVTDNVGDIIENVLDEAERASERIGRQLRRAKRPGRAESREGTASTSATPRREFPEIIGWQPLILNHPQQCGDCGTALARGDRAVVGMTASGLSSTYLCRNCLQAHP